MYRRTAREEILAAFSALERRHRRTAFSLAELLDELRSQGAPHKESTLRTHITSVMCADAPANHASRYDDLERVGPGVYRRREE